MTSPIEPSSPPPGLPPPPQAPAGPPPSSTFPRPNPAFGPPLKKGPSASLLFALGCSGFIVVAVLGIIVLALVSSGRTSVDADTVLKVTLRDGIPEYVAETGLEVLLGQPTMSIAEHLSNFKKAAADTRIKGVVLRIEPLQVGWAKIEELRDAVVEFKKSGKFVIAYGELLSEKEYALALAADEIVMPKDAPFHFDGLAMDISHYPGLLEKLGIEVQYFRYGKYKSASGEQMGRKAFTEPVKEMLEENLERVYSHFVAAVAAFRKLEEAKVRGLIDESGFKSDWALERKLIDKLAYWDEVEDELRGRTNRKPGEKINWVSSSAYRKVSATSVGLPTPKHTFALIYSQGIIVAGKGGGSTPLGDGETQGTAPIIEALRRAVEDEKVKAIIFRVDSPGGAGLGCDYIRREIERARAKKPIIVSMSDVAASGGYWVSMDATAIVAQPSTATGSIGIYSVVPNLAGLYDKLALNNETFKRGAHADALIGARKLDEAEAKRFDDDLHASYLRFVELAAKGRSKPVGVMQELAQGRTWYGSSALENGLVDKLGGFPAAIALAKQKAGLAESDTVGLEVFHKRRGLLEQLLNADEDQEEEGSGIERSLLTRAVERLGLQPLLRRTPFLAPFAQAVLAGETTFPMMEQRVEFR